ncbi:MAG: DUF262 domain-containing protein [Methanomassiliicoccus sp.]|nr:DUF262 domain-containing protein [Methanomassiliicoccus sp.]
MKATEATLLGLLQKSPQFIIPIYQRTYSWTDKQCRQLWEDIIRAGSNDSISVHFIGSIVYVEQGLSQVTHQAPLLVIDGQQRLTTVSLLIEALAREVGDTEPADGFSALKLRHYYLSNQLETGDRFYKLLLSQTDNSTLKAIIKNTPLPPEPSLLVKQNFELFRELLAAQNGDLVPVCRGLAKLVVVDIALNRDQDNPQLIFESMNSTGKELSQADLIRNYILMGLEPKLQTHLYEEYWRPMELDFGQVAYGTQFDSFMRHFLTVKTGYIPRIGEVYDAFKDYSRSPSVRSGGIEALVKDIRDFSRYYCAMALGAERNGPLAQAFHDLRELRVDVAYPFLLELYHDYANGILSPDDFLSSVRLIESYVFRRAICAIPTNSLNKTFGTFSKSINKDRYLESMQAQYLLLPSYRRFPSDEEFRRNLQTRDLYNSRSRSYWIRRMENHERKERVEVDEYTIEHIMPQNPNLSATWKVALGSDWQRVHDEWLHTLGNLTLTGYNSEYNDRPFNEKRDMAGGFKESPLRLNAGLGQVEVWNEVAIKERAERLSSKALEIWSFPELQEEVLEQYRPHPEQPSYSIEDHPFLLSAGIRELFEALRKEVLGLDPCVSEEFLKYYVAYKAETNFVDVVPQSKRLRLSLNLPFPEINDPKKLCRDVTEKGRWGNGDVEIMLNSIDELPYIMSLVRQAFEWQMGNGEHP